VISTGGTAASIPADIGTINGKPNVKLFGGIGGVRSKGNNTPASPQPGGGGSGGYSTNNGQKGGNGELTIVLKYFKEEGKAGAPSSTVPPATSSSLLWDLSMNMGSATGGGWYSYDDQTANNGYSSILFHDNIGNQYRTANNVMEWDGGVSFSLNPLGFEYAYAGAGFAWLGDGAVAPNVWGTHTGVCLEYSLSGGGDYYLKIATAGYTEDNEFKVSLPKQAAVAKRLFLFNNFTQGEGWGVVRTLAGAKQNSVGMQIQGEAPLSTLENDYSGYLTTQTGALTLKSLSWDSCN
jgi:hypothetical protein